ncbi:MAG: hypothetical protein HY808_05195 [Nitrospirae bacterium]|nr:hypothetical protein [Nitrospirota bacterium]
MDNKKQNIKNIEQYGKIHSGREVGKTTWPLWICNDIIGYLLIGVDPKESYIFELYGIDHKKGYKRIPPHPGWRRSNMMGWIEQEKYGFTDNYITPSNDGLSDFLKKIHGNLGKRKKYFDLDYWLRVVTCFDLKKFLS